jgi:hypothetical protein
MDIIGFAGLYQISNYGQLHILPRFRNGRMYKERFSWGSLDSYGYLRTVLTDENHLRHHVKMHQLTGLHFVDNPNGYTVINHDDGVKTNNYYKNLKWSTLAENNIHAYEVLGKCLKGERNGRTTLTEQQVVEIKRYSTGPASDREFATRYNTRWQNIQSIRLGWTWKHIQV